MQRYEFCPEYETYEGKFTSQMEQDEDGKYVLYSDASSLLTASEARVKELETALQSIRELDVRECETHNGTFKYVDADELEDILGDVTAKDKP